MVMEIIVVMETKKYFFNIFINKINKKKVYHFIYFVFLSILSKIQYQNLYKYFDMDLIDLLHFHLVILFSFLERRENKRMDEFKNVINVI
jgi:hypothetical protein